MDIPEPRVLCLKIYNKTVITVHKMYMKSKTKNSTRKSKPPIIKTPTMIVTYPTKSFTPLHL